MNTHKNAPLTPKGREAMVRCVEAGLSKAAAARQFNTTAKTVAKSVQRFGASGVDGFRDRSSRASFIAKPNSACHVLPPSRLFAGSATRQADCRRGRRVSGDHQPHSSAATVCLNRLSALEPAEPVRRYEREHRGELIHIDIQKTRQIQSHRSPHQR